MEKVEVLYDICEYLTEELKKANKELEKKGGEMSAGDLEVIDKLTHALKSTKTTIAMIEAEEDGYSSANYGDGGSYNRGSSSYRGSSYARGRRGNVRRDSMGRYSRDSYARGGRGYSRDDAKDEMMERLHEMEMSAGDDETRRMVGRWIRQIEQD